MSVEPDFNVAVSILDRYIILAETTRDGVSYSALTSLREDFQEAGGDEAALKAVVSERITAAIATPGIYILQGQKELAEGALRTLNYVARVGHMVGVDITPMLSDMVRESAQKREARLADMTLPAPR